MVWTFKWNPFRNTFAGLLTADGSLRRHVSHMACTNKRHSDLSVAFRAASFQDFHRKALLSLSTILLQVSFVRPTALLPTGVQFRATRQSFLLSSLSTCPIHLLHGTVRFSIAFFYQMKFCSNCFEQPNSDYNFVVTLLDAMSKASCM